MGRTSFSAVIILTMGLGLCGAWAAIRNIPGSCDPQPSGFCNPGGKGDEFAHCVTLSIAQAFRETSLSQRVSDEPIRGYLKTLSGRVGYKGESGDLEDLQHFSTVLKTDPNGNRKAIAALDDAIASYAGELRTAMSVSQLAASQNPGTDIYPLFVPQKLHFLDSDRAKFYDKGPYEIIVRSLLAGALEADFFLNRQSAVTDPMKLQREITVLDEVLERRSNVGDQYLSNEQNKSGKNSDSFWRASLLFALGRKDELRIALHDLVSKNSDFSLDPLDVGYIYVNKVFNFPYKILVRAEHDGNGSPLVSTTDPALLQRFYNPAQLALFTCALIDDAGLDGIDKLADTISSMPYNDYFVVAGSGSDHETVEKLKQLIAQTIDHTLAGETINYLDQIKTEESVDMSKRKERGEKLCGIDEITGAKILSPFKFDPRILDLSSSAGNNYIITFGGNLNLKQAKSIADFLNKDVFSTPDLTAVHNTLGIDRGAYIARMRIED
jgi:hypothetical protein